MQNALLSNVEDEHDIVAVGKTTTSARTTVDINPWDNWTEVDVSAVKNVFAENIKPNAVWLAEVNGLSKNHHILKKIACTKIRDKILPLLYHLVN